MPLRTLHCIFWNTETIHLYFMTSYVVPHNSLWVAHCDIFCHLKLYTVREIQGWQTVPSRVRNVLEGKVLFLAADVHNTECTQSPFAAAILSVHPCVTSQSMQKWWQIRLWLLWEACRNSPPVYPREASPTLYRMFTILELISDACCFCVSIWIQEV